MLHDDWKPLVIRPIGLAIIALALLSVFASAEIDRFVSDDGQLVVSPARPVSPVKLHVAFDPAGFEVVEGDRVAWVGPAAEAPAADTAYDAGGRIDLARYEWNYGIE